MKIPLLDLAQQYPKMKEELYREWSRPLETMKLLEGDNLKAFQNEIAAYLGTRHAFGILGFLVVMVATASSAVSSMSLVTTRSN
jgi:dTDP-4-amino-4,6-dideoxygalactose transaminase